MVGDARDRIQYIQKWHELPVGAVSYVINILFGNANDEAFWAFDDPDQFE